MTGFILWILESSLLVLMILGIRKVFQGKIHYSVVYVLWLVVLIRFLVPVNFIPSPFGIGDRFYHVASEMKNAEQSSASFYLEKHFKAQTTRHQGKIQKNKSKKTLSGEKKTAVQELKAENGRQTTAAESRSILMSMLQFVKGIPWTTVFIMVWGIGTVGIFCCFAWSNLHLLHRLSKNRQLLEYRGDVAVYSTNVLHTPCLYGIFHPAIYLPECLLEKERQGERIGEEETSQMILHEYVHYLHGDYIWSMFRMLMICAYWFDPFVWIAAASSKKDAELFCDETVLRLLGEEKRFQYGNLLIRIAGEHHRGAFRYSMMTMSRKGKELENRILAISNPQKYSKWTVLPLFITVGMAVLLTCSNSVGKTSGVADKAAADKKVMITASPGEAVNSTELIKKPVLKEKKQVKSESDMLSEKTTAAEEKKCQKLFKSYVLTFTKAVNSGNAGMLKSVVSEESAMYKQQSAIAKNYYKRGIREKVKGSRAVSVRRNGEREIQIDSKEEIKVFYADKSSRIVKQSYCYTCVKNKDKWIITAMQDIE